MPAYDYKCMCCGRIEEHIHAIEDTPPISSKCCNTQLIRTYRNQKLIFSPPFRPYFDVSLGRMVQSKAEIKEILARNPNLQHGGDKELDQEADKVRADFDTAEEARFRKEAEPMYAEALALTPDQSINYWEAKQKE